MSMATMNPGAGGPVGGGMVMMNSNMAPAVADTKRRLNTYIYDYMLKHGHYEAARTLSRDDKFEMTSKNKQSLNRKDGEMNGDGGDTMDMDFKDDAPDDLTRPSCWEGSQGNGFLLEWFGIFNDLFAAHRQPTKNTTPAAQYLINEKNNQRLREMQQNQIINRQGMNPMSRMQNGAMNGKIANLTPQQMAQIAQNRKMAAMQQQQIQRGEQPDAEMNGVRPGTPAEGDNSGSPSKRPRLENGQQFNQGMMPNGRPGGVPGGPNQGMMIQAGFNPNGMNPQFPRNGAMPPKGMQGGMPNGMMNMANAGSPMMQNMNQYPEGMQMDMYNQRNMQGGQPMQGGGPQQSGNHALQDYQMQLMLLEQQNKKRLMMARQEQHENGNVPPGMVGNMQPAGMSPSGSRTGTSPNPGEMKRTPGIGGIPGSPSAGEAMAGRSPAGMGFNNMMQGPDFNGGMFMGKDQPMMGPGGPGMRPPTSADMTTAMRQQGARPNQQFPGGQPMAQQPSQGAAPGMGTPGQRNEMPPPQAPAGNANNQRNGSSPSGGNAPPTPSQANKPNPKNKKAAAKDDNKRQRPAKKNSAANAPASDDNPPATPTPSTPITPNNPGAINGGNKGPAGMQPGNAQHQNPPMQLNHSMQQTDLNQNNFGDNNFDSGNFNLDFSTLENADVLENFDFDSFLNTSADDTFNFSGDMDVGGDFTIGQTE